MQGRPGEVFAQIQDIRLGAVSPLYQEQIVNSLGIIFWGGVTEFTAAMLERTVVSRAISPCCVQTGLMNPHSFALENLGRMSCSFLLLGLLDPDNET